MLLSTSYIVKIIEDGIGFKWNMHRLGMNKTEVGGSCLFQWART